MNKGVVTIFGVSCSYDTCIAVGRATYPLVQPCKTTFVTKLTIRLNVISIIFYFCHTPFNYTFLGVFPRLFFTSGAYELLQYGPKVFRLEDVPSCSANLWASLTSEENPLTAALSSNYRSVLIIGSELSYNLTVAFFSGQLLLLLNGAQESPSFFS